MKVDEKFNSIDILRAQALDTFENLRAELDKAKGSGNILMSKTTKEMELYLSRKIEDANAVGASKLALVEVSLRRERQEGISEIENEMRAKIDEAVSSVLGVENSSRGLVSGSGLGDVLDEINGRLH